MNERCESLCLLICLVQVQLGTEVLFQPDQGSNSRPPDHDSTLHVTEMPALTTRPSVMLPVISICEILIKQDLPVRCSLNAILLSRY